MLFFYSFSYFVVPADCFIVFGRIYHCVCSTFKMRMPKWPPLPWKVSACIEVNQQQVATKICKRKFNSPFMQNVQIDLFHFYTEDIRFTRRVDYYYCLEHKRISRSSLFLGFLRIFCWFNDALPYWKIGSFSKRNATPRLLPVRIYLFRSKFLVFYSPLAYFIIVFNYLSK
jgi:hypothetical protein